MLKWLIALILILVISISPTLAATVIEIQGSEITWHTGSSTLANNTNVVSSAVSLSGSAGYRHAWCNLSVPMSAAPTANSAILVWFHVSTDTTTYPDGSSTITPARSPDMVFPLRAVTGTQVVGAYVETMPVGVFQVLIRNDATGATMNTTWTLKCKAHTEQVS